MTEQTKKKAVKKVTPVKGTVTPKATTKKTTTTTASSSMIVRLKIKSFDHQMLDKAVLKIVEILESAGAFVKGPIPLPTKIKKWAFRRPTFKFAFSGETIEQRQHSRLIDIVEPTPKIIDTLQNLSIPNGVSIKIQVNS